MRLEFESKTSASPRVADETANQSNSAEADQILRDGVRAAQEGRRSEAKAMLLRATELDPRSESAWLWLASISEYPEELLAFLNNVLDINPSNERAVEWKSATRSLLSKTLVQRGVDASRDNRHNFARQCFEQAVEHDSNNEMAWLWLASVCDSDAEKAGIFERVLEINPDNDTARESLEALRSVRTDSALAEALAQAVEGHHEAARQLIDVVVVADPDCEIAWELRSHLSNGFEDRAESLLRLRSINPENEFAKVSLASWRRIVESAPVSEPAAAEAVTESAPDEDVVTEPQHAFAFSGEYAAPDSPTQDLGAIADEYASSPDEPAAGFAEADDSFESEAPHLEDLSSLAAELEAEESEMSLAFAEQVAWPEASNEPSDDAEWHSEPEFARDETAVPEPEAAVSMAEYDAVFERPELDEPMPEAAFAQDADHGVREDESAEEWRNTSPDVFVGYVPKQEDADQTDFSRNGHDEAPTEMFVQPVADSETFTFEERTEDLRDAAPEPAPADHFSEEPAAEWAAEPMPAPSPEESAQPEPAESERSVFEPAPRPELSLCPFCNAENEKQAHYCDNCNAVLGLTDLDFLLGNQNANEEILKQAVESFEREHEGYGLNADTLAQLGVGHINLKNYRQGLAYLQEAVHLNPSNVVLDAQVNAFAIRLSEMEKQAAAHESMSKNRKILVVDDSPTVRKLITSKLEKCGHEVHCAVDGLDALEKLNSLVPDLILLDITMPRMDGYQVCKLIRNNSDTRDVPVVMISGKDGFFDKVRGRMAGTTDYITKPFGPETLMRTVESYLS